MLGWIILIIFILIYFYLRFHLYLKSKVKIDWNHTKINYSKVKFRVWEVILYFIFIGLGILCPPILLIAVISGDVVIIPLMILATSDSYLYDKQYKIISPEGKSIINFLNKELW